MGALPRFAVAGCLGDPDFDRGFLLRVQAVEADPRCEGVQRFSSGVSGRVAGFPFSGIKGVEFFVASVCLGFGFGLFDSVSAGNPEGVGRDRKSGGIFDPWGASVVHHRGGDQGGGGVAGKKVWGADRF